MQSYGSSYGWNTYPMAGQPTIMGGGSQPMFQPQPLAQPIQQPIQPAVVLSGAPLQQQQQPMMLSQQPQGMPMQMPMPMPMPMPMYGGGGGFGGPASMSARGFGAPGSYMGGSSYNQASRSYRNADDLNLKPAGSFIGPGPDLIYYEDVYDAPKREYVDSYGRSDEKDMFYEKVLKERFGDHLTILPKKKVLPPPKPAPPPPAPEPVPVVTRAVEPPPKPARPNTNNDLHVVGTTMEGQTVNVAGWYADSDGTNTTYRWTSRGNVVGYDRTLLLNNSMVGAPVVCEATHSWYSVPTSATATSAIVTAIPAPAPAPVPVYVPPQRTLNDIQLQGGPNHSNPITAFPIWNQGAQPGQVTAQWYRSLKGAAVVKQTQIANANKLTYSPTVDDLHAYLHVRMQQIDETGAAIGEPVEKQVPDSFLVVDKGIESALAQEFKVNRAVFVLTSAANSAEQRTIALSAQGIAVYDGPAAAGQPVASGPYDANLRAVLNYDDNTSFTLAMGGFPNMMFRAASALDRDHVVLSIRSFKGLNMARTQGQVQNVVKMYHKSHADGKY